MDIDPTAAIKRLIIDARTGADADDKRSDLFDRYLGEPYGDEIDGRSKFISTDASDAVEGFLPDILDPFTSSENIIEFDPVGSEDEDAAKQETDVVSHIFWQKNEGFLILYNWLKDGLIAQNSYVKSGWIEKERVSIEEYEDLTPDELYGILAQTEGEYQIERAEGIDLQTGQPEIEGVDPQTGQPKFAPINVRIRCVKVAKEYEIVTIPQDEFFCSPRWSSVALDGIPCCGHMRDMERGELRRMGFSEESIARGIGDSVDDDVEAAINDTKDHFSGDNSDGADDSTRMVTVYEAYCRVDINGDGRAELVKVWAVGDGSKILQWDESGEDAIEEVSHVPFSVFTPYIVPHRHVGRSLVEQVDDIAQVKTVLMRHTLDNLYATNYARPIVAESGVSETTYEDLMNPAHGAPINVTAPGTIEYVRPPSVADTTLPLMQVFDSLLEMRVGNSRYAQGIGAEALNPMSEATANRVMDASMKRRQLIARIFAEVSLKDLFLRIHRDLRSGPHRELVIKLRNEWVPVNPRTWRERTDMTVRVGMGSADRDVKRQGMLLLAQTLEKLAMDPEIRATKLVGYPQFREVAEEVMETFGYDNIDRFMPPPENAQQPPPQQPGPQEQIMQAQMQMAQQELTLKQQKQAAEIENARREVDLRHQRDLQELQYKYSKLALDQQEAVMGDDFKRDKLEVDARTAHMRKEAATVQSTPPIGYGEVTNGQD